MDFFNVWSKENTVLLQNPYATCDIRVINTNNVLKSKFLWTTSGIVKLTATLHFFEKDDPENLRWFLKTF